MCNAACANVGVQGYFDRPNCNAACANVASKVCTTQLIANQNRPSCNAACANVAVQGLHNTADCKSKSPELHHCQKISPESARSDKTDKTCLSYITSNDS